MKGYGLKKITRTGTSLTVTLPLAFVQKHQLKAGENILVLGEDGKQDCLKVVPLVKRR